MGLNRYAKRRDANEPEIMSALLAIGCTVEQVDPVDLIVGYRGKNYLLEVKVSKKERLTPKQVDLRATWRGQYAVVCSAEEALAIITGANND